jgi:hypothetical protein
MCSFSRWQKYNSPEALTVEGLLHQCFLIGLQQMYTDTAYEVTEEYPVSEPTT